MKHLLVVYHSQSGASALLAKAAVSGARSEFLGEGGGEVHCLRAWDAGAADVEMAHALLLVAAENAGALAGGMKDFLDRAFYPLTERDVVLPYALIISAGNDGRSAAAQATRQLRGIPLVEAQEPLILRGDPEASQLGLARDLGQALAAGLQMGIF